MNLIKLDATESTNRYLKALVLAQDLEDLTVVSCRDQTKGRGQRGAKWESEAGKNLTFSILKYFDGLLAIDQFRINIAVSLAVYTILTEKGLPDISVKWPNDIMAGDQKICGILMENIIQGKLIAKSIIGIGLNVNQKAFKNLGHATSMCLIAGFDFDLDEVLLETTNQLKLQLSDIYRDNFFQHYESVLYRYAVPTTFVDPTDKAFVGSIQGVAPNGKIKIKTEKGILKQFGFKEVKMVY